MIAGLLIGMGMMLPGVSGGVIAVILGIYDKIIFAVNNFKDNKKENILFLLKIFIGIIIGVIISANVLVYFFDKYYIEMSYLFMGLILGTIPLIIKEYNKKCNKKLNYYILICVMLLSFILSLSIKTINLNDNNSLILLFISGFLFAIGKIIPGLSSSVLLNLVGKYSLYLTVFSNPIEYLKNNIIESIVLFIGFILGVILSIKFISYMLKKYYDLTYSVIIGFVMGSLVVMYPGCITIPGVLIMFIGIVLSLGIPLIKK